MPAPEADQRSAHPGFPGVPTWVAVLTAATATLTGFAIEAGSGHQELGAVFAVFYALGCIAAVLVVRKSGVFTAVVQPPLVLFVAVPVAYYFFHGSAFSGLKDVIISCGYPLIERFPLMLVTSAAVLLIGLIRWYAKTPARPDGDAPERRSPSHLAGLMAKIRQPQPPRERPRHPRIRPEDAPPAPRAPRGARGAQGPQGPQGPRGGRGAQPAPGPRPPREMRTPAAPLRDPRQRSDPRQRREPRPYREPRDHREPYYPPRPVRDHEQRRRPVPDGASTHHPVSQVRYRAPEGDRPREHPEYWRR